MHTELASSPRGRLSSRQLVVLDVVAAAGYLAVVLSPDDGTGTAAPGWARVLLLFAVGAPVAVRRRWPLPVLGVTLLASMAAVAVGVLNDPLVALALAAYPVAVTRPHRLPIPTAVIGTLSVVILIGLVVGRSGPVASPEAVQQPVIVVLGLVLVGFSWTVGRTVRDRRAYAEQAATQRAERAVADERLRIARELHDVVAHSMGVIAVKAGVANHVVDRQPDEARAALQTIESSSRDALAEMRQLLGLLRATGGAGEPAALHPTPGLAALPDLVERAAQVGVRVDLDVDGAAPVPEGVGLSVYRIVQEAITNVVKHAAPARCRVRVATVDDEVRIEVDDDGPGVRKLPAAPGPEGGHGLVGMRERVGMYHGRLRAGPAPDGGFQIRAVLPYGPAGENR